MDESIFDKLEGLFKGTVHKEIQDMEATVFHLETDKKRLEGEMEQLRSMNKSCQVVIDQLQQDNQRQMEQIEQLQKLLRESFDYKSQYDEMKCRNEEYEEVIRQYQTKTLSLMDKMEETKVECMSIVKKSHLEVSKYIGQCDNKMAEKDLYMQRMIGQIKKLTSERDAMSMQFDAAKEKFERQGSQCRQYKSEVEQWEKKYHEELHKTRMKFQERIIQLTSQAEKGSNSAKTIQMYKDRLIQQKNEFTNEVLQLKRQIAQIQTRR